MPDSSSDERYVSSEEGESDSHPTQLPRPPATNAPRVPSNTSPSDMAGIPDTSAAPTTSTRLASRISDPEQAEASTFRANQFIVANAPLPSKEYPDNAPLPRRAPGAQSGQYNKPLFLQSLEDLKTVLAESREKTGFSNYDDISTPSNSARNPVLSTLARFSTRFANGELAEQKIIKSDRPGSDVLFDLSFPVNLVITDQRGIPLPGLPLEGIPDSQGYPLLYKLKQHKKIIKARSSATLYPVNLSRGLSTRLSTYPDHNTLRTWAHMFQLTDDKEVQAILLQRVMGSSAGDNHIALLLKAYLAFFDSIAGSLDEVFADRLPLQPQGTVINVTDQTGWATQVLASTSEIVNVLGGSPGYQEFWAYCCFDMPPVYAAKTTPGSITGATLFSQYRMDPGLAMVCLCDTDAYSLEDSPAFFGKPDQILGYIETYVQKFGLQEQANEALQIAMLWPSLVQTEAYVSLPKPLHTADWLGAEVERPTVDTAYSQLLSCGPFKALASTLAGAWAMQSQIYDLVTLLTCDRNTWALPEDAVTASTQWLVANISAPGVGWNFLFSHQFNTTPSFLYLTGLSAEVVDWPKLLATFTWKENQFPAHLRLIQPFWVETSVCCLLPWEDVWKPELNISADRLTATPASLMRLLRLSLLDTTPGGFERAKRGEGIYPLLTGGGRETIAINSSSVSLLQTVVEQGVRLRAQSTRSKVPSSRAVFMSKDPEDSESVRAIWSATAGGSSRGKGKQVD